MDPWRLRAEGLDRPLAVDELAVALGHIARHRGFRSNAKREAQANAAADASKMKKAIAETQERLAQYRSLGEMLWRDERFREARGDLPPVFRGRNRDGDYSRTVLRADLEAEVGRSSPRSAGSATDWRQKLLQERFAEIAFSHGRCGIARRRLAPARSSPPSGGPRAAAIRSSGSVCFPV